MEITSVGQSLGTLGTPPPAPPEPQPVTPPPEPLPEEKIPEKRDYEGTQVDVSI